MSEIKKKKIKRIIIIVLICLILLFPIKESCKDGGTVKYSAILYRLTFWHSMNDNYESGFYEATEFKIFPFNWIEYLSE